MLLSSSGSFPNYYDVGKYFSKSIIDLMVNSNQDVDWYEIVKGAIENKNYKTLVYSIEKDPTRTLEILMMLDNPSYFTASYDLCLEYNFDFDFDYLFNKTSENNKKYFKYATILASGL